ncbi:MFS transporter [Actinomadura rayongensis]|uniref:MFS transporter n=1 Tax=Actinomadura rayongensis TaxID=1429076 RepID=A0A6I4WGR9_9ACTN|nr:MFS transporter [Actinomadura rayongensis]MXQ66204.1 MFS transporter [Actinomadura rayongensis]
MTARRPWTIVWLLFLFMVVNFADKAVLGLAGRDIQADLRLGDTAFGTVGSAFYLLFSVSGGIVGFLADRVPARGLLAALVLLWSGAQLVAALPAAGFAALVATRVVLGAAEGPAFPLANHTAFGWFPDRERAVPGAMLPIGAAAGVAVGAPVLALTIGQWGWRSAFALTGVLGLAWTVAWLRFGADGPHAARAPEADARAVPYLRLLGRGSVLAALAACFAAYWMLAVATTWLPQYLQRVHGHSLGRASMVAAVAQAGSIALVLGVAVASRKMLHAGAPSRIARGVVGGSAIAASGLAVALLTRVEGTAALVLVLLVAFAGAHTFITLTQTALAEIAPVRQRAPLLGAVIALASTAGAFGPAVTGALVEGAPDAAEGFGHAFDLAAVLLVAGGLLAGALVRPERDRAALGPAADLAVAG